MVLSVYHRDRRVSSEMMLNVCCSSDEEDEGIGDDGNAGSGDEDDNDDEGSDSVEVWKKKKRLADMSNEEVRVDSWGSICTLGRWLLCLALIDLSQADHLLPHLWWFSLIIFTLSTAG